MNKNKKIKIFNVSIIILLLIFFVPFLIYAYDPTTGSNDTPTAVKINGVKTDGNAVYTLLETSLPGIPDASKGLGVYLSKIFNLAIGVASVLAVLMIVIGGFKYMTSDAVSYTTEAKKQINDALLGLVLVLASWLILNTINTDLVNFNTGLTPIPYKATPTNTTNTSVTTPQISNTTAPSNANVPSANISTTKTCWCATFLGGQQCFSNEPTSNYNNTYNQTTVPISTLCN